MDIGDVKYLEAPAKVMKLSEAIRIGATLRPQCFHQAFYNGGSCALGAAYEAIYGKPWPEEDWQLFPIYTFAAHIYPGSTLEIALMNDRGMTREQIADWLEAQGY